MGHESEPTGVNATKYVAKSWCYFEWCRCSQLRFCACRYVSQLWIRCLPVPVHTTEGGFTGSYMSLVEKQRQKDPDHIDEMLVRVNNVQASNNRSHNQRCFFCACNRRMIRRWIHCHSLGMRSYCTSGVAPRKLMRVNERRPKQCPKGANHHRCRTTTHQIRHRTKRLRANFRTLIY